MTRLRLGLAVALALATPAAALAEDLAASVDAVRGDAVTLTVAGALDPQVGDRFVITFAGFDDGDAGRVAGVVTEVTPGRGLVTGRLDAGAIEAFAPWPGLPATIASAAPVERRTAANDPWLRSLDDIEGLLLPPTAPTVPVSGGEPDPADPETAGLIMAWIRDAEPPANAEQGTDLRYTDWAQLVGRTATGTITASGKPDDAAGYADPALYLWARHQALGSLNLCALGEYVRARLAGGGIDSCASGVTASATPSTVTGTVVESEPNQSAAEAGTIHPDTLLTGTIAPRHDADWFRFEPPHHGELTIAVDDQPGGLDTRIAVHPEGGNWLSNLGADGAPGVIVDVAAPKPHFIKVDSAGAKESSEPYRLSVTFKTSPDAHEPNASAGEAASLSPPEEIVGTILPRHDQDWFRIDPDHHGELTVALAAEPEGLDTRVAVHPEAGNWLSSVAADGFAGAVVDVASPIPHFLKVDSAAGRRSIAPYRLALTFRPSPDEFEPNPNAEAAAPLPPSGSVVGTILPRHDQDWFRIEPTHHGELTIAVEDAPGLDTRLAVHPENGNWLSSVAVDGFDGIAVDLARPIPHFLKVDSAAGARDIEPYRLAMTFRPSPDAFEPNPNAAAAKDLPAEVVATILPRHDQDWFRIDPDHHGELTIALVDAPDGLETRLGVHPENGNWLSDVGPEGFAGRVVDLAAPIPHFIKVDSAAGARSVDPYRLAVTFRPSPDTFEPNPSAEDAGALPGSGTITGTILPRHDQDWFRFRAAEGDRIAVSVETAPADLDLRLGVHPESGNWLRDLAEDSSRFEAEAPVSGTYYLKIDSAAGSRSIAPYRVTVRRR